MTDYGTELLKRQLIGEYKEFVYFAIDNGAYSSNNHSLDPYLPSLPLTYPMSNDDGI